jgi:LPXTG-motif cell wall-anchored protein
MLYIRSVHINSKKILSISAATVGALALVSVGATSSMAQAPDVFSVMSLTTDNPVFVDANALAGDDDGFIGVTGSKFLFSGDDATIAYDLADMGNPYTTNIDNGNDENNWLFTDLKTQNSYLFNVVPQGGGYDISGIRLLDQTGDISALPMIPLSDIVTIDNSVNDCTIFASGYGRVAIWDGCAGVVYDVELPSGAVTAVIGAATFADYLATAAPLALDYYETGNEVSQIGVVEYDGAALHIIAVAVDDPATTDNTIGFYRYDVEAPAAAPTEVLSFGTDAPDIWELTLSPATNQWCSGAEGGWDAISAGATESELAFCASATLSTTAAAPALANTGVETSGYLAVGGVILLAGAAMVLVARRRTAKA